MPAVAPFPEELWNQKMCGVVWAYTGDDPAEATSPRSAPSSARRRSTGSARSPHPALNSMFDGLYPPGDQWYWKADFVKEIPDEAVDIHVEYGEQLPTWKSTMHLYPIDGVAGPGAARTPPPGTTATPSGAWSWSGSAPTRPTTRA